MKTLTPREAEVMSLLLPSATPILHQAQQWYEMLPVFNDFIVRGYASWSWIQNDGRDLPNVSATPSGIEAYRCWQAARSASCL